MSGLGTRGTDDKRDAGSPDRAPVGETAQSADALFLEEDTVANDSPLKPGDSLNGKYVISRALGHGGMGSVYEARHTGTGRRVAVKVISGKFLARPNALARFTVEARAAGGVESEHVVHVLDIDVDTARRTPYMVMEYLAGEDLNRIFRRLGALPVDLALRIIAQVLMGLEKAHAADVVHRDIKPANIFLSERDGGSIVVKLLDFGIAKIDGLSPAELGTEAITQTGEMIGSPPYMSPEQARGHKNLDHRTDLWSVGVLLYKAVTGHMPHQAIQSVGDLLVAICVGEVTPALEVAPGLAPEVVAIIEKAMTIDLEARYQSATEMLEAVLALLPQGFAIDRSMIPLDDSGALESSPSMTPSRRSESGQTHGSNPSSPTRRSLPTSSPPVGRRSSTTPAPGSDGPLATAVSESSRPVASSPAASGSPYRAKAAIAFGGLLLMAVGVAVGTLRSSETVSPAQGAASFAPPKAPPAAPDVAPEVLAAPASSTAGAALPSPSSSPSVEASPSPPVEPSASASARRASPSISGARPPIKRDSPPGGAETSSDPFGGARK